MTEIILRFLGLGYGHAPFVSDPVLHHVHPINYRFVSHTPHKEFGGHEVYYDHQGLTSDPEGIQGEQAGANCRIAFVGDSFVEAGQVAYRESFPGLLARSSRRICEVRNFGVSSYSPVYYLVQWEEQIRQFQPTHVFLLLVANDISTDEEVSKLAKMDSDGFPVAIPGPGGGWLTIQLRKSYLVRFFRKVQLQVFWSVRKWGEERLSVDGLVEEQPDIGAVTSRFLLELKRRVERSGAHLTFMAVPSQHRLLRTQLETREPQFSERCKAWAEVHSVDFIDLVKPFEEAAGKSALFFKSDGHFNQVGHFVVAQAIQSSHPELFAGKIDNPVDRKHSSQQER